MSVLKGLQDLLLKMGGTPSSGDNTDELVRKIAKAYDPATQELPSVTSSDKNKYLHTNSLTGALEWDEIESGGSDILICEVVQEGSSGESSMTYSEIEAAINAGKRVILAYKEDAYSNNPIHIGDFFALDEENGYLTATVIYAYNITSYTSIEIHGAYISITEDEITVSDQIIFTNFEP